MATHALVKEKEAAPGKRKAESIAKQRENVLFQYTEFYLSLKRKIMLYKK